MNGHSYDNQVTIAPTGKNIWVVKIGPDVWKRKQIRHGCICLWTLLRHRKWVSSQLLYILHILTALKCNHIFSAVDDKYKMNSKIFFQICYLTLLSLRILLSYLLVYCDVQICVSMGHVSHASVYVILVFSFSFIF